MKKMHMPYCKTIASALVTVSLIFGCQSMNPDRHPSTALHDAQKWYGTYIKEDHTFRLTISKEAFIREKQMRNGAYRHFNEISPYTVESHSEEKLVISGPDVNSATQATVTYAIVKSGNRYSLESQGNGRFHGFLEWYQKEETAP